MKRQANNLVLLSLIFMIIGTVLVLNYLYLETSPIVSGEILSKNAELIKNQVKKQVLKDQYIYSYDLSYKYEGKSYVANIDNITKNYDVSDIVDIRINRLQPTDVLNFADESIYISTLVSGIILILVSLGSILGLNRYIKK